MKLKEPKPKENPTLSEFMMQEAEAMVRMLRDDLEKVKTAMKSREMDMEKIKAEQLVDYQTRLKVEGGLSACQHLVTKYKQARMNEPSTKQVKRTRTTKHGADRS